jgi:hypothetical protein
MVFRNQLLCVNRWLCEAVKKHYRRNLLVKACNVFAIRSFDLKAKNLTDLRRSNLRSLLSLQVLNQRRARMNEYAKAGFEANPDATQRAAGDVVTKGPSQTPEGTPRAGGDVYWKGPSQDPEVETRAGGDVVTKGASDENSESEPRAGGDVVTKGASNQ